MKDNLLSQRQILRLEQQNSNKIAPFQQLKTVISSKNIQMFQQIDSKSYGMKMKCCKCNENEILIAKYQNLLKLLKKKIKKLEKQQKQKNKTSSNLIFNEFIDFDMISKLSSFKTLPQNDNQQNNINRREQQQFLSAQKIPFEQTVNTKQSTKINKLKNYQKNYLSSKKLKQNKQVAIKQAVSIKDIHLNIGSLKISSGTSQGFNDLMEKSAATIKQSLRIPQKSNKKIKNIDFSQNQVEQNKIIQVQKSVTKNQIYQSRIQMFSSTILDLKSFIMHVRNLVYHFVKLSDLYLQRKCKQSFEILNVLLKIFQFSEDEQSAMFESQRANNRRNRISQLIYNSFR